MDGPSQEEEQLLFACQDGRLEEINQLLQNPKINLNCFDFYSRTPFFSACGNGHIKAVNLFLNDARVNIGKRDRSGRTPFYAACQNGHIEIVKLLFNHERVDINQADYSGWTPFAISCQVGQIQILKLFLNDERVDINQASNKGRTPLDIAHSNWHLKVVQLILISEKLLEKHVKSAYANTQKNFCSKYLFNHQDLKPRKAATKKLLEEYLEDKEKVKFKIKKELGILDQDSAKIYSLMVLVSDNYLKTAQEENFL